MSASATAAARRRRRRPRSRWPRRLARLHPLGILVFACLVGLGALWDSASHARPSYDAFGWLVWGHQALYGTLNTNGAPSWKPLTFLFTLPYGLFGRAQPSLWTLTASTSAIASAVFAARIAFRLARPRRPKIVLSRAGRATARPGPERRGATSRPSTRARILREDVPALVGAVVAGAGVLGMAGLSHQVLIATSDPMVVTLCLAAVDAHLSRRPGLGFGLLVLAALGRPETWPFLLGDAAWLWVRRPSLRPGLAIGVLLVPLGWFLIPGLTSRSWFISGDLAENFSGAIHGNRLVGVVDRFLNLYELPVRIAVAVMAAWAAVRRDRVELLLILASVLWVAVEWGFALHGWPASARYMMEPAAVLIALTGAAVGRALRLAAEGWQSERSRGSGPATLDVALRFVALASVMALAVSIVPIVRDRQHLLQYQFRRAAFDAMRIERLDVVLRDEGGAARVRRCGQPVVPVGFQSTFAWDLGMNVGGVGYKPGREFASEKPIVTFKPAGLGWLVHPIHLPLSRVARCAALTRELTPRDDLVALPIGHDINGPGATGVLSPALVRLERAERHRGRRTRPTSVA